MAETVVIQPQSIIDTVRTIQASWLGFPPKEKNLSVKDAITYASGSASSWAETMPKNEITIHPPVKFNVFPALTAATPVSVLYNAIRSSHLFHDIAMAVPSVLSNVGYAPITYEHELRIALKGLPSSKENVTGIADLVCVDVDTGTKLAIADVKTIEQRYNMPMYELIAKRDHFLQTAMYAHMLEEMARFRDIELNVDEFMIIGVDPFYGTAQAFSMPSMGLKILKRDFGSTRTPLWKIMYPPRKKQEQESHKSK